MIATQLRTSAAFTFAVLALAACGGSAPPANATNGGCSGVWSGTECVHDVRVAGVAPLATAAPTAPTATQPTATPIGPTPTARTTSSDAAILRARDPRTSFGHARALPLLVTEIEQLEALSTATPDKAADKPMLLRRLAEDYVELAVSASAAGREPTVGVARKQAIKNYDLLIAHFPSYAQLDEARYFDALEHERSGDVGGTRQLYLDVILHHPASKFVPYCYFAFGDAFLAEGASDPTKLDLAEASYQKVVAIPPPDNRMYGWAWLRIGGIEVTKGHATEAHDAYAKAKEFATSYAQLQGSADLAAALPP